MSVTEKKFCSRDDLKQVIVNSHNAIFATDRQGNVILCNPASARILNSRQEDLIGKNVNDLIKLGIYDRSVAMEAIETCSPIGDLIINRKGNKIMSFATPIFDKEGELSVVVVNSMDVLFIEKIIHTLEDKSKEANRYKNVTGYLNEIDLEENFVIARSSKMKEIINKCYQVAKSDSTVVLLGESGTGKEVMARLIHRYSQRAKEPFIPVNCPAIPVQLLESEFFGYIAGAFTGASNKGKAGIFEIANKGTLFLDEIGELPLSMQAKLLRVLETGEVRRLGSTDITKTNIRFIAATNRDLKTMVKQNLFRSDLYYRLNVIPISLPPLRERPDDVMGLAELFLQQLNRKYGFSKEFTPQAIMNLLNYNWPGNVRELRNVVERLVVYSKSKYLDFGDDSLIGKKVTAGDEGSPKSNAATKYRGPLKSVLKEIEEDYINMVLAQCDGHIGKAAELLGMHRTMLYRKLKATENSNTDSSESSDNSDSMLYPTKNNES